MKINDILGKVSAVKKNKISQLLVRELDEEPKGTFIAFVDDQNSSYDVSVSISNDELKNHNCDCDSKDVVCLHKLAVLFRISNQEIVVPVKKQRAKKVVKLSEAQQILQELNLQEISSWLHQFFNVNKEAEAQFLHQFSKQNTTFQLQEIEPIINKSFTSFIGKRKKIELNELKKIIQFLEQSLEPVFDYMQTIIIEIESFSFLEEITFVLSNKRYLYSIPGTRLQKLEIQYINKYSLLLNNIQEREVWQNAINILLKKLFDMEFGRSNLLLIRCIYDLNKNGNKEQKEYISNLIYVGLQEFIKDEYKFMFEINKILLQILIENNKLEQCFNYFEVYPYEHEYNLLYLNAIKDFEQEKAVNYCYDLIAQNSKADYQIPYLRIAEEILVKYDGLKNELAKVRHDLFLFEPDFENYLFVIKHLDDKNYLPKFRNSTLSRLKNSFYYYDDYKVLYFQILDSEQNYKKMIEVIKETSLSYKILEPYLEKLVSIDKLLVLTRLCKDYLYDCYDEDFTDYSKEISAFVKSHFEKDELEKALNEIWSSSFRLYNSNLNSKNILFKIFE